MIDGLHSRLKNNFTFMFHATKCKILPKGVNGVFFIDVDYIDIWVQLWSIDRCPTFALEDMGGGGGGVGSNP